MERNASDGMNTGGTDGGFGTGGSTGATGATGATTGGFGQEQGGTGMGAGGSTGDMGGRLQQGKEAVTEKLSQGKDAMADKFSQVKDKASGLKSTLADKLEAGANTLREKGQSGQLAGAMGGAGATAGVSDERMQQLSGSAANALQSTATFLREGDLQASIEEQVRTNPGRTLLIALGVGYMLGKALRR